MHPSIHILGRLIIIGIQVGFIGCSHNHCYAPQQQAASNTNSRTKTVRVAGVLLKWIAANREQNYRRVEPLIRQAARKGAQVVITTECFLDGYAIQDKSIPLDQWRALGEEIPHGMYVRRLQKLASELGIYLVAGMVEREGTNTFNAALLIGPNGEYMGKYRKHNLEHEQVRNTPGSDSPVFDTHMGRVGLMICADRREPDLVRRLKRNGAEWIICPSGGMWGPRDNDHLLQARSRENNLPIVFVHPIEFLITAGDGSVLTRHFAGKVMSVTTEQIGTTADENAVVIYDLPLSKQDRK